MAKHFSFCPLPLMLPICVAVRPRSLRSVNLCEHICCSAISSQTHQADNREHGNHQSLSCTVHPKHLNKKVPFQDSVPQTLATALLEQTVASFFAHERSKGPPLSTQPTDHLSVDHLNTGIGIKVADRVSCNHRQSGNYRKSRDDETR